MMHTSRIAVRPSSGGRDLASLRRSLKGVAFLVLILLPLLIAPTGAAPRRLMDDDDDHVAEAPAPAASSASASATAAATAAAASKPGARSSSLTAADDDDDDFPVADDAAAPNSQSADSFATAERPPFQWQNFPYEFAALVFIVAYVVNLFIGRARNAAIALQWHDATRDLFASQFAALSAFADGSGAGATFLKDSHNCFKFYASGRRHCAGMLATLDLRARQCLFATALSLLDPSSARDSVTLEFPLDELEPLVLCLARKRDEARLRRALPDLDLYATSKAGATSKALTAALAGGKQGSTTLPFAHTLMVDAGGAELDGATMLDERVCAAVIKHADLFAFVHVSDQHIPDLQNFGGGSAAAAADATAAAAMSPPRKMLRVKMYLPADLSAASPAAAGLLKLTEMALYLLDRVAAVQLPLPALNRAREARAAVAKRNQKTPAQLQAEAAARRREEKRAKEAELVAQMTPEQLRRHEEREAKERAKRTQHKVRVLR